MALNVNQLTLKLVNGNDETKDIRGALRFINEFCCEEQDWTKDYEEIFAGGYKTAAIFLGFVPAMKEQRPTMSIQSATLSLRGWPHNVF